MNAPSDIEVALAPVIDVFERHGIAYAIGGSVATLVHGEFRATNDVDVVADLRPEHAAILAQELGDAYYADEESIADAIRRRSSFNLIHLASMLKVDVFVLKGHPYARESLRRSIRSPLAPTEGARGFTFSSREDIVLAKLDWFRKGGEVSERQWRDVQGVMKVQREALDLVYLRRWATELGVTGLLERALAEAGLG